MGTAQVCRSKARYVYFRTLPFGCGGSCDGENINIVDVQVLRLYIGGYGKFHDDIIFLGIFFERTVLKGIDTLFSTGILAAPQFGACITEEEISGDALLILE